MKSYGTQQKMVKHPKAKQSGSTNTLGPGKSWSYRQGLPDSSYGLRYRNAATAIPQPGRAGDGKINTLTSVSYHLLISIQCLLWPNPTRSWKVMSLLMNLSLLGPRERPRRIETGSGRQAGNNQQKIKGTEVWGHVCWSG